MHQQRKFLSLCLALGAMLVALVCLRPTWAASPNAPYTQLLEYSTSQTLTQTAPTLSTDGSPLGHTTAFRVSMCATSGTLSGAGNLRAWVYVPTQAHWMRNPELDLTVTSTGQCQLFPDMVTSVHSGRVKFLTDGVTTSGATTATILLEQRVE